MKLALFAAVFLLLPLVVLRGRTLGRYFACDGALWAGAVGLAAVAQSFRISFDSYLACVAFAVVKLAVFALFLANADARDVRWSANRAALCALLVYTLLIPAMTRTVIDGDEPYYLLMTESLVHDHDLDLRNQYATQPRSQTGRTDLRPQYGDPLGRHGEQRSHLEPLLAMLMIPGYLAAGLPGALFTIVVFAALLARATVRLFEDEGIDDATTRALFPLVAFGPPIVFYAARIWPEIPGAWMFVEAVRGIRQRRPQRWMSALLALVLLKLRFVLIAVVLFLCALRTRRQALAACAILVLPLIIFFTRSAHSLRELIPGDGVMWLQGLLGLAVDGQAGIAFQAPLYLAGILALARWRAMPPGFRLGISASVLYIFTLVPRPEWHGGWSPPLRYIVIFMPILALGIAAMWKEVKPALAPIALWTMMLLVHGTAFPWRLFHIADGQNFAGEWLSALWQSDFGRLMPSLIRPNFAAAVAGALLVAALLLPIRRIPPAVLPLALTLILAAGFEYARRPAARVEFEDAFVQHNGGELFPHEYAVSRFIYRGGWILRAGDTLRFPARGGPSAIEYQAAAPATIELAGRAYQLAATAPGYGRVRVVVPHSGVVMLRCLAGSVNLDRLDHE
jgi:hypothetical protein